MATIAKFKTKAQFIQAYRIQSEGVGPIGSWVVLGDDNSQSIVSNEDFLKTYIPAGRGTAKALHTEALNELGSDNTATSGKSNPEN